MAGRVVLIEGLDLAGKSTLVRNLQAELTRRGIAVRISRNALCPDNPIAPVADALRRDPGASLLETGALFLASHLWDARNFEPPPEGVIHIQDSCWLRTLAYHTFHGTPRIPELLRSAAPTFPGFDAAVFLTADLAERRLRLGRRESEHPGSNDANDHMVINKPDIYLGLESELQALAARYARFDDRPDDRSPRSVAHSLRSRNPTVISTGSESRRLWRFRAMIHVVVGTRHLQEILGYGLYHPALLDVFYPALDEMVGRPLKSVDADSELAKWTVFDVLEEFHEKACTLLMANAPEIIEARQKAIMDVARDEYHQTDFECTSEDASHSFAIHGVHPHGSLSPPGKSVWLPDFSTGAQSVAFFANVCAADREKLIHGIDAEFWARYDAYKCDISDFECHLCDTLSDVYRRAVKRWKELENAKQGTAEPTFDEINRRLFLKEFYDDYGKKTSGDDHLVIDAIFEGFARYSSLKAQS